MKLLALLLLTVGLGAQDHDGGFTIRFEPTAVLQAGVPVPFEITVKDPRHEPFPGAKVTLQIETDEHQKVEVFKATQTAPGVYVAKPKFGEAGSWLVYVHVQRNELVGERTIKFNVAAGQ